MLRLISFAIIYLPFFALAPVYSQLYFVNTFSPTWENDSIYRVENDYSYSTILTLKGRVGDIAISPSGIMYGIDHSDLVQINFDNGELIPLVTLPFGDYSYSLVCGNDNNLYTLAESGVLYAFDILNDTLKLVDYLGDDGRHAGDITFYRGNILFQGYANSTFFAYNLQERDVTKIFCSSMSSYDMNAIGNIVNSCGEEQVYGITAVGEVYEFDFDNNTLVLLHKYGSQNFSGYGMATVSEQLSSVCNYHFSGGPCGSVGINESLPEDNFALYPNPADNVLFLENESEIESIKVYDSGGMMVKRWERPNSPLDVHELPQGIYYFQICTGGKLIYKLISIR